MTPIRTAAASDHRPPAGPALALWQLMRPSRPAAAAAYALIGAWLGAAAPARLWSVDVFVAAGVVALITAFGFVINDVRDIPVDRIGKPGRPLPSGRVSAAAAGRLAWSLALAGLLLSTTLMPAHGSWPVLGAAATIALGAAYSYRLKATLLLGNATVALLVASTLCYGAGIAGSVGRPVLLAALLSFVFVLAQELLFNLEDEDEDRAAGLRTTATRLGPARSLALLRGLLLAVILVGLMPVPLGLAPPAYALALGPCIVLPTWWLRRCLREPLPQAGRQAAARFSRLLWLTSVVPLLLLR